MVEFVEQTLSHSINGPYVMFTIEAKLKFTQQELGAKWRLETTFLEQDRFTPDDVFQDKNWARIFSADREIVTVVANIPIYKRDLNTEPGNEEVYAKLKAVHVEGKFATGEATTNIEKIKI